MRESLRTRILQPLGMNESEPVISHEIRPRLPVSYQPLYDDRPFQRHGPLVEAPHLAMDNAAGCIASTPADMALYVRMLLNRGKTPQGRLLRRRSPTIPTACPRRRTTRGPKALRAVVSGREFRRIET